MKIFFTSIFLLFNFLIVNISSAQELKTITAEEYLLQNPSPERQKIVDFIVGQFDDKIQGGVSQAQLDNIWQDENLKNELFLSRFQIVDQKLYADSHNVTGHQFLMLFNYFQKLIQRYKLNDVDFIVYTRDEIPSSSKFANKTLTFPAFMTSKDKNNIHEKDKLLIPDPFMLQEKWEKLALEIEQSIPLLPWQNKLEKIYWRGYPSGLDHEKGTELEIIDKMPRISLVLLSALYPNIIDAGFVIPNKKAFFKESPELATIIDIIFADKITYVPEKDHLKYKYLISIDGSTCAWRRVPWIMLSNSVLVKQETNKIEWFYPALQAYINYVPVNENLTDIFAQLEWMKNHDQEVQQISLNAQNFVKNNLMPEDIDAHFVIILNEYSKIQKDNKIYPSLTPAKDVMSMPALLKLLWHKIIRKLSIF